MKKVVLKEICNPDHTLTLFVKDSHEYFRLTDITKKQLLRVNNFTDSCLYGWYSDCGVKDWNIHADKIVINHTGYDTGYFHTGYVVYDCDENWIVHFMAKRQGQQSMIYVIPKCYYPTAENAIEAADEGYIPIFCWDYNLI